MKHLIYLALFLLCLNPIATTPLQAEARDGVYFGAGCGASFDNLKYSARNVDTHNRISKRSNRAHCIGTAFLGYGLNAYNNYFIGGEIGTTFPERTVQIRRKGVTFTDTFFKNKLSIHDYFNADLLIGYRFDCNFLFYGRVGLTCARLKLNQATNVEFDIPGFSKSSNKCGYRLGCGINFSFTSCLALGVDYVYSEYPSVSTFRCEFDTRHKLYTHTQSIVASLIWTPNWCNWYCY